jgi:hypothetical protein
MTPPTADAGRLDAGRELRLGLFALEWAAAAPLLLYRIELPVCAHTRRTCQ